MREWNEISLFVNVWLELLTTGLIDIDTFLPRPHLPRLRSPLPETLIPHHRSRKNLYLGNHVRYLRLVDNC